MAAVTLVPVPLSPFWIDENTGTVWGPDPNGTVVSPTGYKLAPLSPVSTGTDSTGATTQTYAPISDATAQAAKVPPGTPAGGSAPSSTTPTTTTPKPPTTTTPVSSAVAQLQKPVGGVPLWGWLAGGALAVFLMRER